MPGVTGSSPVSSTIITLSREPPITIRPWTLRRRELAFAARPWVEVYMDTWTLPDGRVREGFHHIVLPDFAVVIPVTADRRFVMIREYKQGPEAVCLNAPAGGLQPGEDPRDAARRELLEETGYAADDWQALGIFAVDGSTGCGRAHVFLARGATRVAAPQLDETEEIEVVLLDEPALRAALRSGEVTMMPTACAVGLALLAMNA
jgi:ADP-ribose pyrophosphatase